MRRWRDGTFVLGRLLGVEIHVHPSWLIVFALVVVQLVDIGVPGAAASLSLGWRWLLAVLVALLFFTSVLLHEMAHALVARRRGLVANEITLYIFGGAAKLEQESPSPATEALVGLAGPVANLALGAACLALYAATKGGVGEAVELVSGVAFWLGLSNLLLGGFNLFPGFPMDGGRILRAVAWAATGDFVRATRIAALVGRAFAYLLIGFGFLVAVFGGDPIMGIWLAFIGWFLNIGAEANQRRVEVEQLVRGLRVRDAMERDFPVLNPHLTLDTLVDQHLLGGQTAFYPVVADGRLIGGLDIATVGRVPREARLTQRVSDVMIPPERLPTAAEDGPLWSAILRLEEARVAGLPVVAPDAPDRLVGLLTRETVFRALRARSQAGGAPPAGRRRAGLDAVRWGPPPPAGDTDRPEGPEPPAGDSGGAAGGGR